MRFHAVIGIIATLMIIEAFLLLPPTLTAILYGESIYPFLIPLIVYISLGLLLRKFFRNEEEIGLKESFLIVSLAWFIVSLLGAIPYLFYNFSFVDAFFESASGFTTTGATVIENLEVQPKSLLFWRSFEQWIGGMGIIVLFIAILPKLSVGGRQLFSAEVPGPSSEKLKPRIRETAKSLWIVYLILSALEFSLLVFLGSHPYEALLHTFSTMSTGGFSPLNSSIGGYNPMIQTVVIIFMFFAGANFMLHYHLIFSSKLRYLKDEEFRFYSLLLISSTLLVFLILLLSGEDPRSALLVSSFQVTSIMTTTGFTTSDFNSWPSGARMILLILMFIGGCAGSTAGGIKTVRILAILKYAVTSLKRGLHPKGVFSLRISNRVIDESIITSILGFTILYVLLFVISSIILSILGYDLVTSISAVSASIGNVGPGLGLVGPRESYAFLHPLAKLILSFNMIVGRLEIIPVILLFYPKFWKE